MSEKVGRNDPCPCGSGTKYKRCCLARDQARQAEEREHAGATERAIRWLAETHRDAMLAAYEALRSSLAGDDRREALDSLDPQAQSLLRINLMEWLLAEGSLSVNGEPQRISGLLLGAEGVAWTAGQRSWLQRLADHPLRLYEVLDIVPGRQLTLRDAIVPGAASVVVGDGSASEWVPAGSAAAPSYIACRVLPGREGNELSGAVFPFPRLTGPAVAAMLRTATAEPGKSAADIGQAIMAAWVAHLLAEDG